MLRISLKMCKRVAPQSKFVRKISNFDNFDISAVINIKFGTRSPVPNLTFIGPLSKCNTGRHGMQRFGQACRQQNVY